MAINCGYKLNSKLTSAFTGLLGRKIILELTANKKVLFTFMRLLVCSFFIYHICHLSNLPAEARLIKIRKKGTN